MIATVQTIHVLSSAMMMLVMILVQILIYPQFHHVGLDTLSKYAKFHSARISWVVMPLMLCEAASLAALLTIFDTPAWNLYTAAVLLLIIWIYTFFAVVPVHAKLAQDNPKPSYVSDLNRLNSYRTVLWLIKGILSIDIYLTFIGNP